MKPNDNQRPGITVTYELVTPAKATQWLNDNKANRTLREGVVEKYALDMIEDNWTNCTAPIAFYDSGDIADGQHRLWAISITGKSYSFVIERGLSKEDGLNIDTGLIRSLADAARIAGLADDLSLTMIACARACEEGHVSSRGASNAQKMAMVERHKPAVSFAMKHVHRRKNLCSGAVTAAVARAWYKEKDTDRLVAFCEVLGTGMSNGVADSAAVAIRNYLITKGTAATHSATWRDTFLKVQNAIRYFMRRRALSLIKGVAEEAYPLPSVITHVEMPHKASFEKMTKTARSDRRDAVKKVNGNRRAAA